MNKIGKLKFDLWYGIFAVLFAAMILIARHVINLEVGLSTIETTYIIDFHWFDVIIYIFLAGVVYLGIQIVSSLLECVGASMKENPRDKKWWLPIVFTAFIMVAWIPYFMSYRPGGIYFDTVDTLSMALKNAPLDSHNPVLYTMLWRFIFWITGYFKGETVYKGLNLFTELQSLLLAASLSYFIYSCYKRGLSIKNTILCVLIVAIFPLYPYYGISLWKDTNFSIVIFLVTIFLYRLSQEQKENISIVDLVLYSVFIVLTTFSRNNGLYVCFIVVIALPLLMLLKNKKIALKLGCVGIVTVVVCGIVNGPVFSVKGLNIDRKTESYGIPMQQVAYIFSTDGNLDGADLEFFNEIMPLEQWREKYDPLVADTLKFDPNFNKMFLEDNASTFLKEYIHLVKQNPVKAVKAYLLATLGFWDVFESSGSAYISNFHYGNADYFMSDYFDYNFGFSFANMVEPRKYLSAAIFIWLLIFTLIECLSKKNYKGIIPLLPTLGIWITIMLATPIAISFRYVYAMFLCVPIYFMILVDSQKNSK